MNVRNAFLQDDQKSPYFLGNFRSNTFLNRIINTCGDGKFKYYEGKDYIEWKKLDYDIISEDEIFKTALS